MTQQLIGGNNMNQQELLNLPHGRVFFSEATFCCGNYQIAVKTKVHPDCTWGCFRQLLCLQEGIYYQSSSIRLQLGGSQFSLPPRFRAKIVFFFFVNFRYIREHF